jgi:hypothetical protein
VDEDEVEKLCEELRGLIELGPGAKFEALTRARRILEIFRTTKSGDYVDEKLLGLSYGVEQWFSFGKWNRRGDGGKLVRGYLDADIIILKEAMAAWRSRRTKSES